MDAIPSNNSPYQRTRNLRKSDLAGVIFGCKHNTMKECLTKQLFGMPAVHYSYIRKIEAGVPLFLFNYSDRQLYGIFEAAGPGEMKIDLFAWADHNRTVITPFPAQVRIYTKTQCLPLSEAQFKKAIGENYYTNFNFWFELDHAQTMHLISLFKPVNSGYASYSLPLSVNLPPTTPGNPKPNISYKQTLECSKATSSERKVRKVKDTWADMVEWEEQNNINNAESGFDEETVLNKLRALAMEKEGLMGCASENFGTRSNRDNELKQIVKELVAQTIQLQKKQVESLKEIECLNDTVIQSERKIVQLDSWLEELELRLEPSSSAQCGAHSEKLTYLVGGFDGSDWLSSFDAFSPVKDRLSPLKRMSGARAYSSVAALGEGIFVLGGSDGNSWSDIVECYKRSTDEWVQCGPLSCSKGSLAGITLGDKIFAIGGGDREKCYSCVEILDPSLGKWVFGHSMNEKRFAPAVMELNGAIYTVGGYDGKYYLKSAERYDPREGYWTQVSSMTGRRGCLSLAKINENLYAVGGFDGEKVVSSVEIFDPRLPSWFPGMPMQKPRGYAASAMIDDTFYVMGGLSNGFKVTEIVECFNEKTGWYNPGFKSIGKRCFFSAVVM